MLKKENEKEYQRTSKSTLGKNKNKGRMKKMRRIKEEKGITLVALVITIIILIILATVAINFAFGNNGLINRAEQAKDFYANDTQYTDEAVTNVESYLDDIIEGAGVGGGDEEDTPPAGPTNPTTVAEAIENVTKYTKTTPIKDDLDNTVYIPGGFHLAADSATKVEGGIVIEDDSGNQFVWIPTGEYKVSTTLSSTGTLTNELSRRTFTSSGATPVSEDSVINSYYYGEGDSRSCTIVDGTNSIDAFKTSATNNGGFYIGRYEQGENNVCKAGITPYVNVTRDTAKSKAESMYSGNTSIKATTQLISSYAWDTALNFICQTNTAGYTLATTTSSSYGNIGTSSRTQTGQYKVDGVESDKYSNIYDLLGNCREWTTEYCSDSNSPCVIRGGIYGNSSLYAALRNFSGTSSSSDNISFRSQLYV